jgi:hypothetical protein
MFVQNVALENTNQYGMQRELKIASRALVDIILTKV